MLPHYTKGTSLQYKIALTAYMSANSSSISPVIYLLFIFSFTVLFTIAEYAILSLEESSPFKIKQLINRFYFFKFSSFDFLRMMIFNNHHQKHLVFIILSFRKREDNKKDPKKSIENDDDSNSTGLLPSMGFYFKKLVLLY